MIWIITQTQMEINELVLFQLDSKEKTMMLIGFFKNNIMISRKKTVRAWN
jgi:hypothetical protein